MRIREDSLLYLTKKYDDIIVIKESIEHPYTWTVICKKETSSDIIKQIKADLPLGLKFKFKKEM